MVLAPFAPTNEFVLATHRPRVDTSIEATMRKMVSSGLLVYPRALRLAHANLGLRRVAFVDPLLQELSLGGSPVLAGRFRHATVVVVALHELDDELGKVRNILEVRQIGSPEPHVVDVYGPEQRPYVTHKAGARRTGMLFHGLEACLI